MSHLKAGYKRTTIRAGMVERVRNGHFMHQEWTETQRETDAMASEWQDHMTQSGDLDSEVEDSEYSDVDYPVPEMMGVPLTAPVVGESFCQCDLEEPSPLAQQLGFDPVNECLCGEEDQDFDWEWDDCSLFPELTLSCDNRKVSFHSDYSCGTAAIRGTKELSDGHHFWEIKMTSPVYGTDMMVGIGTSEVNLEKFMHSFCSMLGHDEASWGLSYSGLLHHKGEMVKFSSRFGQGSIIGLHLDTWNNTLTLYKNRCRLGVVPTRLQNKKFYPMVCSTAAKSSMKVIRARSAPTSLQYLCCARLRQELPDCPDVLGALNVPPGLSNVLQMRFGWVFTLRNNSEHLEQPRDLSEEFMYEEMSPSPISRPVSTRRAWASPSPCTSPVPNPVPFQCPCLLSPEVQTCVCHRTPTPSSSDYESCCSEPEDYQHKKCRWT